MKKLENMRRNTPKQSVMLASGLSLLLLLGMMALGSCNEEGQGFSLPPGDAATGKMLFTDLGCHVCHSVDDIAWIGAEADEPLVELGGETTRVKTYGALVTAIINPSHKIARSFRSQLETRKGTSPMPNYNAILTVQELVDLVTYLENQYDVIPPATYYNTW